MSAGDAGRRVCLFAGGGGTLGTYFCQTYSDEYDIVAVYRHQRPAVADQTNALVDPLAPDTRVGARPVFTLQADVTIEGECERVVEAALSRFGRIDVLVSSAVASTWGPMLGSDYLLSSATEQMLTNVVVPLRMAATVARLFWQGRDDENRAANRNVVNVSSVAGLRIYPGSGQSVYAASKAALNHLTGHMAMEFLPIGVRVNATAANSFPSIVPTWRAAEAIRALDTGSANSTIVVVDGSEDEIVRLDPYVGPARA